jgi:hypothetical protein
MHPGPSAQAASALHTSLWRRHTKKRNKLLPSRTEQLVYVHSNLLLLERVRSNTVANKTVSWLQAPHAMHQAGVGALQEVEIEAEAALVEAHSDSDSDDYDVSASDMACEA